MTQAKTNFIVGLFILIGITVISATIIYVGATGYFAKGSLYAAYFDESVQGLNKDSPVKYRGVRVGQVHNIRIAGKEGLVEVVMRIEPGWKPGKDIVAQLKSIGITGIMFVELDRKKPGDKIKSGLMAVESSYPVIPTRTSNIQELLGELAEITRQLKGLDLPGISAELKTTLRNASRTIADTGRVINSFEAAGPSFERFAKQAGNVSAHADQLITENRKTLRDAIANMKDAMAQTQATMAGGSVEVDKIDIVVSQLEEKIDAAITQISEASRELKELAAKSAIQPSQLLFAAPLPEKPIDTD